MKARLGVSYNLLMNTNTNKIITLLSLLTLGACVPADLQNGQSDYSNNSSSFAPPVLTIPDAVSFEVTSAHSFCIDKTALDDMRYDYRVETVNGNREYVFAGNYSGITTTMRKNLAVAISNAINSIGISSSVNTDFFDDGIHYYYNKYLAMPDLSKQVFVSVDNIVPTIDGAGPYNLGESVQVRILDNSLSFSGACQ